MNEELKKVEEFFKYNIDIKNHMMNTAPKKEYEVNFKKYQMLLYSSLRFYYKYLNEMAITAKLDTSIINKVILDMYKKLEDCYTYEELVSFFKTNISDMDLDFIYLVSNNIVGYSIDKNGNEVLKSAKTINEILHVIHSYLTNDESLYDRLNVIEKKEDNFKKIRLCGIDNNLARELAKLVEQKEIDSSIVDILSLDNKYLLMFRDLGHALSVEINIDEVKDEARISYFIPKNCSIKKIEALPGLNNYNEKNARGFMYCKVSEIKNVLFDFLIKVPTDLDLIANLNKFV